MRTKHLFRLGKVVLLGFAIAVFLASSLGGVEIVKGYNVSPAFAQNLVNTYYVSPSGSDSNPGTQAQPWQSIQKAANVAVAGDMVIVAAGNYTERVRVTHSGITFKAQGNVTMQGITIAANNTTFDGFYVLNSTSNEGGIEIKSDKNTIRNNKVEGATMVGILVQGNDNLVENNEIWGTLQRGTESWRDADGIRFFKDGNVIRGNYIHDISPGQNPTAHIDCFQTWDDAVRGTATNTLIENNLCDMIVDQNNPDGYAHIGGGNIDAPINLVVRDNVFIGQHGLFIWSATNAEVTHNTFIGYLNPNYIDQYNSLAITLYSNASTVTFQNNIIYNMWKHVVRIDGGSVAGGGNLVYRSDGKMPYNDSAYDNSDDLWGVNPLFLNPAAGDFHLKATSPACSGGLGGNHIGAFACD